MRDRVACISLREPTLDLIEDIQMVENVLQGAIVWEAFEKRPNRCFRSHDGPYESVDTSKIRRCDTPGTAS